MVVNNNAIKVVMFQSCGRELKGGGLGRRLEKRNGGLTCVRYTKNWKV